MEDDRLIPLSALQHAVYCMRQAALIHLEQQWAENRFTAEGRVLHTATDRGESRTRGPIKRVHALPVGSRRLALYGICDLVEIRKSGGSEAESGVDYFPVEFKRGKPKPHRADEVQLCAQALCLEEMTGNAIGTGALYYAQTKRRVDISLDTDLRALTEQIAAALRGVLNSGRTPPPTEHKARCKACSLRGECQPDVARRGSASRWMEREIGGLLREDEPE
ncbi:MAG: CRISPR-associated protein Cas4 [Gammaproteobacteria bacterium]|nr:CRISPR-associated protein Cas4 [Gammaproteobacteria bacterium]